MARETGWATGCTLPVCDHPASNRARYYVFLGMAESSRVAGTQLHSMVRDQREDQGELGEGHSYGTPRHDPEQTGGAHEQRRLTRQPR